MMSRRTLRAATIGTALLCTQAQAGGPVVIEDDTDIVQPDQRRNGWLLPLLIIGAAVLIASSDGDAAPTPGPGPGPQPCVKTGDGGC